MLKLVVGAAAVSAALVVSGCGSSAPGPATNAAAAPTTTAPKPAPTVTRVVPGPTVTASAPQVVVVPGPTQTQVVPAPRYTGWTSWQDCMASSYTTAADCAYLLPQTPSASGTWESLVSPIPDGTSSVGVNVSADIHSAVVTHVYPGTSVYVVCSVRGTDVDGRSINYDYITSPATGWMADQYLDGSPPAHC